MVSPLKLLARVWLTGRGCCHLRSRALPEAEAVALLDAARSAIDKAQRSDGIEEVTWRGGRAYVMSRRSPDPDQPDRKAPGFVLVAIPDPMATLRELVADRLRGLEIPAVSDAMFEGWEFIDLGTMSREAAGRKGRGPSRARNVGILILSLLVLVVLYPRCSPGPAPGPVDPRLNSSPPTADRSISEQMEWARDRDQIAKLLRERWAVRILGGSPIRDEGSTNVGESSRDRQLLEGLARLFQRPMLALPSVDSRAYHRLSSSDHAFVAFLERLPEQSRLPKLPPRDRPLSATEALDFLSRLRQVLKDDLELPLDFGGAEAIAQRINQALDYDEFYRKWARNNPSHGMKDNLDVGREFERSYGWILEVRKTIENYRTPAQR